jgi:hypothetical protein|tara:strand:+ start:220 stop:759 length:540 start_codon:yes stop_codon:yes gene_type:complete
MAYDINQLLDDLPALLMQHNRDNEQKRQFDVTTNKSEEENLRNFGQREDDFGLRKDDFGLRKDEADYQSKVRNSYTEIGKKYNLNKKRRNVHEEGAEDYLDSVHAKSWNSWLPRSLDSESTETEALEKYWGDGAPEFIASNPEVYDQGLLSFEDQYNRQKGSKNDQMNLIKMLMNQGGY